MQTRAAQAHPATVFSAHDRIFGSSNDLLAADAPWHPWAPWADSRHLLINGVGMRILADTLPAVLARSGVRVLPSFSSLAPTRFWVLGQAVLGGPQTGGAGLGMDSRGHPFQGLKLTLPLTALPDAVDRGMQKLEYYSHRGKTPPSVRDYIAAVRTYINSVDFASHVELRAFVLYSYLLTLQPQDLPRASAQEGHGMTAYERSRGKRNKDMWRAVFLYKCMFVYFFQREPIPAASLAACKDFNEHYSTYHISVLLIQATGVITGPANCRTDRLVLKPRQEIERRLDAATVSLQAGRTTAVREVYQGLGRDQGDHSDMLVYALAMLRGELADNY
jgi:hypothetical protein